MDFFTLQDKYGKDFWYPNILDTVIRSIWLGLRGINELPGEITISNVFCYPSEKAATLKGKNLLLWKQIHSFIEWIPFQKGIGLQESKQEVTVVSLVKMVETLPWEFIPLK